MPQQSLSASPLIQLSKIWVKIDERDILKAIDFSLQEKEIVTLIGPNGAGKSTLIKVMLGILKPQRHSSVLMYHKYLIPHIAYRSG